jgi:hypothetical protein
VPTSPGCRASSAGLMVRIRLPPAASLARTLRQGWYGDDKPNLQQPPGLVLFQPEYSPTQRRRNQLSTMRPDEPCSLHQHANEVQWEEVGLLYHLLCGPDTGANIAAVVAAHHPI